MATSCRAIPDGGSTKSTTPAAMALPGMPSNFAVAVSCAKVMPPAALIACRPTRTIRCGSRQNHADGLTAAV